MQVEASSCGACTSRKEAEAAAAAARASDVLPQPDGPQSNTPRGGETWLGLGLGLGLGKIPAVGRAH